MQKKDLLHNSDFNILEGLRGLAAIYVVINHCRGHLHIGGKDYSKLVPIAKWALQTKLQFGLLQLTALGSEFVILFFVLSGFSIAHSLSKNAGINQFYKRRFIRLYPPYLLAIVWAAFVFFILQMNGIQQPGFISYSVFSSWGYALDNLLYIPRGSLIPQFWSLTYEVIFYLVIAVCFNKSLNYYLGVSLILYLIGWVYNLNNPGSLGIFSLFLFDYNVFFAFGIWSYRQYFILKNISFKKISIFYLFCTGAFIFVLLIKFYMGESNRVTPLLTGIFSVVVIINFLTHKIQNKALIFLGKMSYTLYITHFATIYLFVVLLSKLGIGNNLYITEWYIWIIGVFVCVIVCIPLYRLAEVPSIKILKKIRV